MSLLFLIIMPATIQPLALLNRWLSECNLLLMQYKNYLLFYFIQSEFSAQLLKPNTVHVLVFNILIY
jgi:hypothetical protein